MHALPKENVNCKTLLMQLLIEISSRPREIEPFFYTCFFLLNINIDKFLIRVRNNTSKNQTLQF